MARRFLCGMSEHKETIDAAYWDWVLTRDKSPRSVYALAKDAEWGEDDFFKIYPSLEAVESTFWADTVKATIDTLEADEEYPTYPPEQQLLAFYYTYIEHITRYRSRFLARFPKKPTACAFKQTAKMRKAFESFVENRGETPSGEAETAPKMERKKCDWKVERGELEGKAHWLQFMFILRFWLEDDSEGFEATDALIEKSVRFTTELKETRVLESAFDLGRFLVGRMS